MRKGSSEKHVVGITVLIVDDEEMLRTSIALRLQMRGYVTLEAANGLEAVEAVRARSDIHVVVLDQKMQGSDASRVLAEMKQLRPEIPIILLTGLGRLDPTVDACRQSFFSVLEKPCDLEELIKAIEDARPLMS